NSAGHEVLVDTWPDFKVVLTRPRREVVTDHLDSYTNIYAAYYRDVGAYRDLLGSVITRNQSFRIHGNTGPTTPGKLSMYLLFGSNPRIPPQSIISPRLPGGSMIPVGTATCGVAPCQTVRLSSLDVSHMDLVNEMWSIGGNKHSRRYLESLIRRFPNFCLLDTSDNPVSWGLSDMFGAMMCSFTLPQHRGHGSVLVSRAPSSAILGGPIHQPTHTVPPSQSLFPSQQWLLLIYPTNPQHAHLPPSAAWLLFPHFPWIILPSVLCL
uniref:Glycine N-acyltransferase-like protein n=1 Tax=Pelusios castaneus TaxID=367368 RepID=A0A8C8VHQ4_9SAUR